MRGRSTTPTRPTPISRAATPNSPMVRRSAPSPADSKITYSFDGDWGNDALWLATTGYAPYDFFQSDNRTRRTVAEDLRMIGDPSDALFGRLRWLAGVYALRLTESDKQVFTWDAYDAGVNGTPGAGSSGLGSKDK